ncbi:hypothetical protein J421_0168 [Gemmatirosa kalamazoonensis]|uniref:FlgN family protein n=1 Tax=Gemmatirosa kalamazoonensis TaxID=861299 RepID=W0RBM1_9BACT|nr:hypothetical protein [Gemmatirosa kalamazoonensis]AHG87705.1 hypothetical protein J421_0168 [Gemmatirosa kalamazoonensis]
MTAPAYPVHPLEASDRLAWQATAAVGLLERFGDLVMVALDAVGSRDDEALAAALAERERLMAQLQPLLADLATARLSASELELAGPYSRRAVATILGPVDEALRYANLLHARLTDEVSEQAPPAPVARPRPRRAALALVR